MTIIIVDDHGDWRDTIAEYIQELGLGEAILTAGSLSELDQLLLAVTPGILVLDAMLPDGDGLSRVSHLRTTYPAMGIIMLTGRLLSEDKVSGLSLGADHYLTKPVNLAELGATLVSLSRRLRVVPSPDPARAEGVWRFDPARRQLLSPTRVNVDITDTESRLLGALIQAAPLPLTRGRLVEALGASAEAYDTTASMPTCTGCAAAARAGRRRHGHTHGLRRRLRLHHARADRGRRQGQGLNPRHPPHRDASRHAPPPPLRALHARRQRPRARQGPRPGCRRADPDLEDAVAPDANHRRARRWRPPCRPAATADANAWRASTRWTRRGDWTTRALAAAGADAVLLPRSKARPSWTRWRGH